MAAKRIHSQYKCKYTETQRRKHTAGRQASKQQVTIKHTAFGHIVKLLGKVPKTIFVQMNWWKPSECIHQRGCGGGGEYEQIQIPKANDQNRNQQRRKMNGNKCKQLSSIWFYFIYIFIFRKRIGVEREEKLLEKFHWTHVKFVIISLKNIINCILFQLQISSFVIDSESPIRMCII